MMMGRSVDGESNTHDDTNPVHGFGSSTITNGLTLTEVSSVRASTSKLICCDFSSDGKLLATGKLDKKVTLWCTDSLVEPKARIQEHSSLATDVRFGLRLPRLATSSFDLVYSLSHNFQILGL